MSRTLSDADVQAIADAVTARISSAPSEILTRTEAMAHAKHKSHAAFCVWCAANKIKPATRGRYSRTQLDMALQREARKRAA
jgi:hypothetical protein